MNHRIFFKNDKAVVQVAGPACIGPDGYYTPYHVWCKVKHIPFLYRYLGLIDWSVVCTERDFWEWFEAEAKGK